MAKITDKMVAKALANCGGFITHAAEQLGVVPSTVTKRIQKSEKLQELLDEIKESKMDDVESEIMWICGNREHSKQADMLKFVAIHQGHNRGYENSSKIEHSVDTENDKTGCILITPFVPEKEEETK